MSNTLLISMFVLLPLALIIVVVIIQSRKTALKRKSEMIQVYGEIIADDHLIISEEDILYNKIFAVDPLKKIFVFVHNHDEPVYDIIRLNGLSGCKVEKKGTSLTTKNNGKSTVELHVNEIYLSFISRDSVLTNLRVYSEILDGQQEYLSLTRIAEQWQQKLNKIINN